MKLLLTNMLYHKQLRDLFLHDKLSVSMWDKIDKSVMIGVGRMKHDI